MGAGASSPYDLPGSPISPATPGAAFLQHHGFHEEKTPPTSSPSPSPSPSPSSSQHQQQHHHHRRQASWSSWSASASAAASATSRLQATLKRRFAWLRRRHQQAGFGGSPSASSDPARQFRAFITDWSAADLRVLLDEFEALHALKEAYLGAAAARPACDTLRQDLGRLLRTGRGSDARLLLDGVAFPVHRAVLAARSSFFARLFAADGAGNDASGDYPLDLRVPGGMDSELLRALLAYLYCGEVSLARLSAPTTVAALCHELGAPGRLSDDLAGLLASGHLADCVLVFASSPTSSSSPKEMDMDRAGGSGDDQQLELPCHRALLASRSPFFCGVIEKRLAARRRRRQSQRQRCAMHGGAAYSSFDADSTSLYAESNSGPLRLVLDEAVLPRRLAPAMLHCLYTDRLPDGLTMQELMELHALGRFLDLACLSRACEDLLAESLSPDTLLPVLDWAGGAGGTAWLHRQARLFLREEFAALLAHSPRLLAGLSRRELAAALRCDFLQAAESDVLAVLLLWGEAQLAAVRDPQQALAAATSASSSVPSTGRCRAVRQKRGAAAATSVASDDSGASDLSHVLGDLVTQGLRTEHLLCRDSLQEAVRRRLLPPDAPLSHPAAWLRASASAGYRHPRLFSPHLDAIRALLAERLRGSEQHLATLQCPPEPPPRRPPASPAGAAAGAASAAPDFSGRLPCCGAACHGGGPDLVATLPPGCSPIDAATAAGLRRRAQELLASGLFVRAAMLPAADRAGLQRQAQLWAVRELGLPDSAIVLLPGCCLPDVAFHA